MIAYQQHAYPYYFILGYNKNHGMIPGFFNGSKAVYAYGGKEFTAKEFYWIVVDNPGRVRNVDMSSFQKISFIKIL